MYTAAGIGEGKKQTNYQILNRWGCQYLTRDPPGIMYYTAAAGTTRSPGIGEESPGPLEISCSMSKIPVI